MFRIPMVMEFASSGRPIPNQASKGAGRRTELFRNIERAFVWAVTLLMCLAAAGTERGIMLAPAVIYVNPTAESTRLSDIGRGREVAVLERARGWVNVMGTVEVSPDPENENDRNVTG